ncbi:MAG: hypothetical protein CM15mV34_2220 [Caudoviricetes sp.]|nr:MAG: hypothetical protein CM15mV34_2220 [Caudoviricetes sp.]
MPKKLGAKNWGEKKSKKEEFEGNFSFPKSFPKKSLKCWKGYEKKGKPQNPFSEKYAPLRKKRGRECRRRERGQKKQRAKNLGDLTKTGKNYGREKNGSDLKNT